MDVGGQEYEEIDFPLKPGQLPTLITSGDSSPAPVAPPRTSSRYASTDVKYNAPRPPEVKPRKPVPPPKPRHQSPENEEPQATSHGKVVQTQSVNVPSLPPKPKNVTAPARAKSLDNTHSPLLRRSLMINEMDKAPGQQMTLSEFVRDHSHDLPLRVRVDEGFCGNDERFIISTGDVYNLHFLKNVKVVKITDVGGQHFSVPLNSSIKFGLLYNPENNFQKSVKGYAFETVTALTSAKVVPKLVYTTTACLCTDPKSSIDANELLLIKKVGKTALKRRPYIKVLNLHTRSEKMLYDDCQGNFTTTASSLAMFLPDLLEHFREELPLQVMLYMTTEVHDNDFPVDLTTQMVTLTHTSIEASIVATTFWGDDVSGLNDDDYTPIAIPVELEIEITLLPDESEDEDLYANTRDLIKSFDPSKVKDMAEAKSNLTGQSFLYRDVRSGHESSGLEIEPPARMYDVIPPAPLLGKENRPLTSVLTQSLPPIPMATHIHHTPIDTSSPTRTMPKATSSSAVESSSLASRAPIKGLSPNLPRKASNDQGSTVESQLESLTESTRVPGRLYSVDSSSYLREHRSGWLAAGAVGSGGDVSDIENEILSLTSSTKSLKCLLDAMQDNYSRITADLRSEIKSLGRIVENLSRNYDRLNQEVKEMRGGATSPSTPTTTPVPRQGTPEVMERSRTGFRRASVKKTADPDIKSRNMEQLASMDCDEVISLLAALNMTQYKQTFLEEQVDGEILAECDEEVLRTELNISSLIHRKRLLSIIHGSQSPVSVIEESEYT